MLMSASVWGIEATIRNFRIEFLIGPHSNKWGPDSIIIIFLSSPFVSLIIAGLISRIRSLFVGEKSNVNLFLIWVFFHSMTFSLGAFVSAIISREVLWHAIVWIGIPAILQYVISIAFIVILYFVGFTISLSFLESCNYPFPGNKFNRQSWLLNAGLKPWLIGSCLIVLAFFPGIIYYELYILLSMLIMIIPLFVRSRLIPEAYTYEEFSSPKIMWLIGLITLLLFLTLRFLPIIL